MKFTEAVILLTIGLFACVNADDNVTTVTCSDCDCPSEKKFDCGYYGIDDVECSDKGCLWCPSDTQGDPWCLFPDVGTDETNCTVEEGDRTECGYYGIAPAECEDAGCCWAQSETSGIPWCYNKAK